MPYRDEPSPSASSIYYDPYRGPVPQTFHSQGESIPMATYANSGRQSPGPNTPFDDPYAAGRRSPGPSIAYAGSAYEPSIRTGTPVGAPARIGTPGGGPYGGDHLRAGTPLGGYGAAPAYGQQLPPPDAYGRRSPGPGVPFGQ